MKSLKAYPDNNIMGAERNIGLRIIKDSDKNSTGHLKIKIAGLGVKTPVPLDDSSSSKLKATVRPNVSDQKTSKSNGFHKCDTPRQVNSNLESHSVTCQCWHHAGKGKRQPPASTNHGNKMKKPSSSSDVTANGSVAKVSRVSRSRSKRSESSCSESSYSSRSCSSFSSRSCSTCRGRSHSRTSLSCSSSSSSASSDSSGSSSNSDAINDAPTDTNNRRNKRYSKTRAMERCAANQQQLPTPLTRKAEAVNNISRSTSDNHNSVTRINHVSPQISMCLTPQSYASQPSSVSCESNCYSPAANLNSPTACLSSPLLSNGFSVNQSRNPSLERQRLRSYRIPHLRKPDDAFPASINSLLLSPSTQFDEQHFDTTTPKSSDLSQTIFDETNRKKSIASSIQMVEAVVPIKILTNGKPSSHKSERKKLSSRAMASHKKIVATLDDAFIMNEENKPKSIQSTLETSNKNQHSGRDNNIKSTNTESSIIVAVTNKSDEKKVDNIVTTQALPFSNPKLSSLRFKKDKVVSQCIKEKDEQVDGSKSKFLEPQLPIISSIEHNLIIDEKNHLEGIKPIEKNADSLNVFEIIISGNSMESGMVANKKKKQKCTSENTKLIQENRMIANNSKAGYDTNKKKKINVKQLASVKNDEFKVIMHSKLQVGNSQKTDTIVLMPEILPDDTTAKNCSIVRSISNQEVVKKETVETPKEPVLKTIEMQKQKRQRKSVRKDIRKADSRKVKKFEFFKTEIFEKVLLGFSKLSISEISKRRVNSSMISPMFSPVNYLEQRTRKLSENYAKIVCNQNAMSTPIQCKPASRRTKKTKLISRETPNASNIVKKPLSSQQAKKEEPDEQHLPLKKRHRHIDSKPAETKIDDFELPDEYESNQSTTNPKLILKSKVSALSEPVQHKQHDFDPKLYPPIKITEPSKKAMSENVMIKKRSRKIAVNRVPPKKYLNAGLFSSFFKTDGLETGLDSIVSEGSLPCDAEQHSVQTESSSSLENISNLMPPCPYGDADIRKIYGDFRLPYDIWLMHGQKQMTIDPFASSRKYKKIKSNVFIDVKPISNDEPSCICKRPQKPEDVACGPDCHNRAFLVECDRDMCPSGELCTNQKMQRSQWSLGLERFLTANRGWGVRTTEDISAGNFILEYIGEVVSEREFRMRMSDKYKNDPHHYCLMLSGGIVIDGYRNANEGRFVNHSCEPNCEMQKWSVNGYYRMGLFALRDIKAGEELSYDYNFESFNSETQQTCCCGSEKCRGVIGGKKKFAASGERRPSRDCAKETVAHSRKRKRKSSVGTTSSATKKKPKISLPNESSASTFIELAEQTTTLLQAA